MSEPRAKAKLPPHIYVYTSVPDNPKTGPLTDAERTAWLYANLSARMQVPAGMWPSRDHLARALGEYAEHIEALVRKDLIRVYRGTYFSANWSTNQPGITSETLRVIEKAWLDTSVRKRALARERTNRKRQRNAPDATHEFAGVTQVSRTFEHDSGGPTLLDTTLRDASLRDSSLHDESLHYSSDESPGTEHSAAMAAPVPPRDASGKVECHRCDERSADVVWRMTDGVRRWYCRPCFDTFRRG